MAAGGSIRPTSESLVAGRPGQVHRDRPPVGLQSLRRKRRTGRPSARSRVRRRRAGRCIRTTESFSTALPKETAGGQALRDHARYVRLQLPGKSYSISTKWRSMRPAVGSGLGPAGHAKQLRAWSVTIAGADRPAGRVFHREGPPARGFAWPRPGPPRCIGRG